MLASTTSENPVNTKSESQNVPLSSLDGPQFSAFSKRTEDGASRASRLSKTFPEVPMEFLVSNGNPESQRGEVLGLGILKGWLGTWMHQSSSVSQDRKILLHRSQNSRCSANPEFESRADLTVVGFLSCCMDKSPILNRLALSVSSQQILRNSSNSWQSLARFS